MSPGFEQGETLSAPSVAFAKKVVVESGETVTWIPALSSSSPEPVASGVPVQLGSV